MDTSEFTKHGFITREHAPRAIQLLEAQADELSATFSAETLSDGMVDIACRLGPSPRRRLAPRVS
jgi:hypothetical protein